MRRSTACAVIVALALLLPAAAQAFLYFPLSWPMRDSVNLATDIYLPGGYQLGDRLPTLLLRTPYDKLQMVTYGALADEGRAVVIQDARGRGASQGLDCVFRCDGWGELRDGLDTVHAVELMPWYNGTIVGQGYSGLAILQYMLSGAASDQLAGQVMAAASPTLYHIGFLQGGVLREGDITGWLQGQGSLFRLPEMLAHPAYDEYWEQVDLATREPYLESPAFHFGGWYDFFSEGAIRGFEIFSHAGAEQQYLVIGPWTHATFGLNTIGELTFPENARRCYKPPRKDPLDDFLDRALEGTLDGFNWPAVSYYTMGDVSDPDAPGNSWQYGESWPPPGQHEVKLYPTVDAALSIDPPAEGTLSYLFDPDDPLPTRCGRSMSALSGPCDLTSYLERDDVLYFQSEPLPQPVEVTGKVLLNVELISDRADTDVTAYLVDLYPDGRMILIVNGILRARFRQGFEQQLALVPGEAAQLTIDLWSTSHAFNTGHRIGVLISSSESPFFAINPGLTPGEIGLPLDQTNTIVFGDQTTLRLPVIGEFPWEPAGDDDYDNDDDDTAGDDDDDADGQPPDEHDRNQSCCGGSV
ncbi:MAG: CocE/NonD family hydrolase [Candidatus Alcyoniella australis]|nr:CocE/NonD family hydrolase [Candidatus Alcyoniella australis]